MTVISLLSRTQQEFALQQLSKTPLGEGYECVIRKSRKSKTLQQLSAIFGVWEKYISEQTGESIADIHAYLKDTFLARIYITDPQGAAQEQWVDLLAAYQEKGLTKKVEEHAKRISLSWATVRQTSEFMNEVEQHYMTAGMPLPIISKDWRRYARKESEN